MSPVPKVRSVRAEEETVAKKNVSSLNDCAEEELKPMPKLDRHPIPAPAVVWPVPKIRSERIKKRPSKKRQPLQKEKEPSNRITNDRKNYTTRADRKICAHKALETRQPTKVTKKKIKLGPQITDTAKSPPFKNIARPFQFRCEWTSDDEFPNQRRALYSSKRSIDRMWNLSSIQTPQTHKSLTESIAAQQIFDAKNDSFEREIHFLRQSIENYRKQAKESNYNAIAKPQTLISDVSDPIALCDVIHVIERDLNIVLRPFEDRQTAIDRFEPLSQVSDQAIESAPHERDVFAMQNIVHSLHATFSNLEKQNCMEQRFDEAENEESELSQSVSHVFVSSSAEIEHVLHRLELSEAKAHYESERAFATSQAQDSVHKTRDSMIDESDEQLVTAYTPSVSDSTVNPEEYDVHPIPFAKVLQHEIVEKLDWTICRLKHALHIDTKNLHTKNSKRFFFKAWKKRHKALKREREIVRQEELALAAEARQRVMGKSSLEEINEWELEERMLLAHDPLQQKFAMDSLYKCFEMENCDAIAQSIPIAEVFHRQQDKQDRKPQKYRKSRVSKRYAIKEFEQFHHNRLKKAQWLAYFCKI